MMACEGLVTAPVLAFNAPVRLNFSRWQQFVENLQGAYPSLSCADIISAVPGALPSFVSDTTGNVAAFDGVVSLAGVSFVKVGGPPSGGAGVVQCAVAGSLNGSAANNGYFNVSYDAAGNFISATPVGVDMNPVLGTGPGKWDNFYIDGSGTIPGPLSFSVIYTSPAAVTGIPDVTAWVGCIIPACGIGPVVPPFPPYLPYSPPFPTITPGTLGSQFVVTYQITPPADRTESPMANYSVFSDFGTNYGYKPQR